MKKTKKINRALKYFNLKWIFSYFSPLWDPLNTSWYLHPDSPEGEWWGGLGGVGVIMGKNKFSLKCFSGKLKLFKPIFFLMENRVIEDPPSQLNEKFHYFFSKPSYICRFLLVFCTSSVLFSVVEVQAFGPKRTLKLVSTPYKPCLRNTKIYISNKA